MCGIQALQAAQDGQVALVDSLRVRTASCLEGCEGKSRGLGMGEAGRSSYPGVEPWGVQQDGKLTDVAYIKSPKRARVYVRMVR